MRAPSRRLQRVAYHEAGHAVASYALRLPLRAVSVVPDDESLGHVESAPPPASFRPDAYYGEDRRTEHRIEAHIIRSLAGPAAQARWAGRYDHRGASADYRNAVEMAEFATGDPSGEGPRLYVAWLRYRAEGLVGQDRYWAAVEALAAELLARRRVGARRSRAVITAAIERRVGARWRRDEEGRWRLEAVPAAEASG